MSVPGGDNVTQFQAALFDTDDALPFKTALQRYGHWPVTVWELDHSDTTAKRIKGHVGDLAIRGGQQGEGGVYGYQEYASVFHPDLAAYILNMYAPDAGLVFDPFAGGGTRALMTAAKGLAYLGVELRAEESDRVMQRARDLKLDAFVHIETGDSRFCENIAGTDTAVFLITCPPYYNLEKYDGGDGDMSMAETYGDFLNMLETVVIETDRVLKPGVFSVWVIGLHRAPDGTIYPMHHDLARIHAKHGFRLHEEVIVLHRNNGALTRVGQFEKGDQRLVRLHEYVHVYKHGTTSWV